MSQLSGAEPPAGLWQRVLATTASMLMMSAAALILMFALFAGAAWGLVQLQQPSPALKTEWAMYAQLRRDVTLDVTSRAEVQAMVHGEQLRLYCPIQDYYFFQSADPDTAGSAIMIRHQNGVVVGVFNPESGFMDVGGVWKHDCETPSP